MLRIGIVTFACLIVLLSACSSNDKKKQPAELVEFAPTIEFQKVWQAKVGDGQEKKRFTRFVSVIDAGVVYTADHTGRLSGVDVETGKQVWQYKSKLPISGALAASNGRLYFGTYEAEVVAIDIAESKELWRSAVSSEVLSAPAVNERLVVVQTSDSRVFALDKATGEQQWKFDHVTPVLSLRATSSPLLLRTQAVVAFDNGQVVSIALSDGSTLWKVRAVQPKGHTELERIVDVDAFPVAKGAMIYVVSYQGNILAINRGKGSISWKHPESSFNNLALDTTAVYSTSEDGTVTARNLITGDQLWTNQQLSYRQLSAPTVVDQYVIVADKWGILHALDKTSGEFVGRFEPKGNSFRSPMLIVNGQLLLTSDNGYLSLYKPVKLNAAPLPIDQTEPVEDMPSHTSNTYSGNRWLFKHRVKR